MIRQTSLVHIIDVIADKARYDECAKKILSHRLIIAWILKCCTKEFSQFTIPYIYDNCISEKVEVSSQREDSPLSEMKLDGNQCLDGKNTEANSIWEQTVYYDIRFGATLLGDNKLIRIIINLEIQLDDVPGYPIVKNGFCYCGRMILNLGDGERVGEQKILNLLNLLFSPTITSDVKKQRLQDEYEIAMNEELENEVRAMCNLSDSMMEMGIRQGIQLGLEEKNLLLAKMMLEDGEPMDKIQRYTEYTVGHLKKMADKMGISGNL